MNKILSRLSLGALVLAAAACSNDNATLVPDEPAMPMRDITFKMAEPASRTTIDYDGADVSHLVWQDGDVIAYVTDVAGDVYRTATVSSNSFTASVPAGTKADNKIFVVYPAGDAAGKTLGQVSLATLNPATVNVKTIFDGQRLPMLCCAPVPEESTATAEFDILASVVRVFINPTGHEEETLQSVTLSANEPLTASYSVTAAGAVATDGEKSITINTTTPHPEDALLANIYSNDSFVYFVVKRGSYTGLKLSVTTDAGTYSLADGKMDVDVPGRTLYRIFVPLASPDAPEVPSKPGYVRITSKDQISGSTDDSYLIVCEGQNGIFGVYNSTNYHDVLPTTIEDHWIDPTSNEAKKCRMTLIPGTDDYAGKFLILNNGIRNSDYFIAPMAAYTGPAAKIAFRKTSTSYSYNYWTLDFDADGNLLLGACPSNYDKPENEGTVRMCYYTGQKAFANCGADADASKIIPVQLYKLVE